MTLIYGEPERALGDPREPHFGSRVQARGVSERSVGGRCLAQWQITGVWLTPACPCQKQAISALLALGEYLERKAHTDPLIDIYVHASPSPATAC